MEPGGHVDSTLDGLSTCPPDGYSEHAQHYLSAFAYRFNRRFDLADLVVRLIVDVSQTQAAPKRVLCQAKVDFESG